MLNENIKNLRKAKGLSQEELAIANSHFLRPAGPLFPASQGRIKRPAWISAGKRGLRPTDQY